ncbi:PspA/IM30 family protein [Desulforegula conservatrix]|uniref:PspA/IM30 family protein n=1 Tax=Desulforegula conservatrix TaxID=153026 RepID=UPI00040141BC|nr:PspA/IM30 family protein [Desulforegula conservatrix]
MSFFKRLFKIGEAEAHAVLDKLEDPIKITEQGIRDLKKDLQESMTSLAEVKGVAIKTRKDADNQKLLAEDYERKAMLLLQKMQAGQLAPADAERLATDALSKKEQAAIEAARLHQEASNHEKMCDQLQTNINKLKSNVSKYENDLLTLKARSKTATASRKINEQLSKIDSSGTISMLEKMKAKVEAEESLAIAYGEMASVEKSVDDEINRALAGSSTQALPGAGSSQLDDLKKKMGIV